MVTGRYVAPKYARCNTQHLAVVIFRLSSMELSGSLPGYMEYHHIELQVLGSKDCAVVCPSQVKLCVHNSQTDGLSATGACRRSDQVAELNQAKGDMNDGLIMEADHRPLGPSAGRGEVGR